MMDADRILRPLDEARGPITELDEYGSPAALTEALRATWSAVERSLRILLRSDESAPDEIRMRAMSAEQMPIDAVLTELRRRDRISIRLAGELHAFRQVLARVDGSTRADNRPGTEDRVGPADADVALRVVTGLRADVRTMADAAHPTNLQAGGVAPKGDAGSRPVPTTADSTADAESVFESGWPEPAVRRIALARLPADGPARRVLLLVGGATLLVLLLFASVRLWGGPDEMEQGITAFEAGRTGVAERHFRSALEDDSRSVTARLYLARIVRQQGRHEEAAVLLREAAALEPRDAGVRRELGWLFLDLDSPSAAADQFRQATELEPDATAGWVGLVQALRRAGDPSAEEMFRRAPEEAKALLRAPRTP